ncbi:MAG: aminopeptidase P family protein, partial [Candidatus Aminicenantes bacterium]|nr:aminopeptidase P family protein [Candidatus Aminicenantes bacterium]
MKTLDPKSPYFVDFPGRVRALQEEMARAGIDVYLGSRLRTLSWL